ncbi:MAG: sensor histidine kinase [Paenisporosarcina sp.]
MNGLISRLITIVFLLTAATFALLTSLWGWPTVQKWDLLWKIQEGNLPFGVWILMGIIGISFFISTSTTLQINKRERSIDQYLRASIESEKQISNLAKPSVHGKLNKTMTDVFQLISTQKRSLQRLTDERAEGEDKRIQERVIQERQRLARELHDSVSQQLFAASMLLSAMTEQQEQDECTVSMPLMQAEKMVQQAQLEMRALLLHLRPAALHNKSLAQGLEELLVELQQKVHFSIQFRLEDISLSKGAEDHLFRIAQETLSNTLRHANATEVEILFIERDGLAIFRVQDNGVGFRNEEGKAGSYGLQHIEERAIEMGGTSKFVSVPSQGTIIEVKVPVEKEGEEK